MPFRFHPPEGVRYSTTTITSTRYSHLSWVYHSTVVLSRNVKQDGLNINNIKI